MTYHHGNLRQAILDRAAAIIAEQGLAALSLRGVARDIGVSHAAPARHFKDKDALIRALAHEGFDRVTIAIEQAADAAGIDPMARYNAMGKATVRFALQEPAYFTVINHPDIARMEDDKLRARRYAFVHHVHYATGDAYEAGWHPESDSKTLLAFSTATALGLATILHGSFNTMFEEDEVEDVIERVMDMLVPKQTPA